METEVQARRIMIRGKNIKLPAPNFGGSLGLQWAIKNRRSIREYKDLPVALEELSQILWSAQGITDQESGGRGTSFCCWTRRTTGKSFTMRAHSRIP